MSTYPFRFHIGISVLHSLLVQATFLTESIKLQKEARLPSTCPSGLPSACTTLRYWGGRHKDGQKHLGAHLVLGSLHPIWASFLVQHSPEKGWPSLLLAAYQVVLLGFHAVEQSRSFIQFTCYHIPTKILLKTQQQTKSVEPRKLENGPQQRFPQPEHGRS